MRVVERWGGMEGRGGGGDGGGGECQRVRLERLPQSACVSGGHIGGFDSDRTGTSCGGWANAAEMRWRVGSMEVVRRAETCGDDWRRLALPGPYHRARAAPTHTLPASPLRCHACPMWWTSGVYEWVPTGDLTPLPWRLTHSRRIAIAILGATWVYARLSQLHGAYARVHTCSHAR